MGSFVLQAFSSYIGRFAPSPTGLLHAGSLVAALGSWLDARAQGGRWFLRIEDVDRPRCRPGVAQQIVGQLSRLGLAPDAWGDGAVCCQSQRDGVYAQALRRLYERGWVYPCTCTRAQIMRAHQGRLGVKRRLGEWVYAGHCRPKALGDSDGFLNAAGAWRFAVPQDPRERSVHWQDRRLGALVQDVAEDVGDFVLRRADGCWAYQLAVVVDDAAQGVTHVVRGADLADNTPRQILLQRALGLPTPKYLHLPLVLAADGHKLSKQNGAQALDLSSAEAVMQALQSAAQTLGLPACHGLPRDQALQHWVQMWQQLTIGAESVGSGFEQDAQHASQGLGGAP